MLSEENFSTEEFNNYIQKCKKYLNNEKEEKNTNSTEQCNVGSISNNITNNINNMKKDMKEELYEVKNKIQYMKHIFASHSGENTQVPNGHVPVILHNFVTKLSKIRNF